MLIVFVQLAFLWMFCESKDNSAGWRILPQFPNHMLFVHFENRSAQYLNEFFSKTSSNQTRPKCLLNYDLAANLTRPPGYQFLNLIFLKNWDDFLQFSSNLDNIRSGDVVMFVVKKYKPSFTTQFYYKGIERAQAIFIYVTSRDVVYSAQYYNDENGLLHVVEDGIPDLASHMNDFRNFKEYTFKVGYSNCEPFIYKDQSGYKGVEYVVLILLARMLNFKVEMVDFSNYEFPRTSMIYAVRNRSVHIAMGCLSNTINRNKLVEFTSEIHMEHHTALYSSIGYTDSSLFLIIAPFDAEVWIYLIVTIILMGFLIKKMCDFLLGYREMDFFDYVKVPFRTMVDQPVEFPSTKVSLRTIYLSWMLVATVITNSYKSKLSSFLIKPSTNEPEGLANLVLHNFLFEIPSNDPSFLNETLSTSNHPTFHKVLSRWHQGLGMCEAINRSIKGNIAVIDEVTSIIYMFWQRCSKEMTEEQVNLFRLTKYKIVPNSHVWAIQRAAPFKKRFTVALQMFQDFGIVRKWYQSYNLTRSIPHSNQMSGYEVHKPLDIKTVCAPFLVLIAGATTSLFVLILEQTCHKHRYNGFDYIS